MVVALGLDCSTQQFKGIIIDYNGGSTQIVKEAFVPFDDLTEYK